MSRYKLLGYICNKIAAQDFFLKKIQHNANSTDSWFNKA